jgi:anti-sigma regulatory factor (Ser/Thr protein kinase)
MDQRLDLELPRRPSAVRAARGSLASLDHPFEDDVLWRAKLVLSELATNVVRHAGHDSDRFEVHLGVSPGHVRIEICNSVPEPEHRSPVKPDSGTSGGMGLYLVDLVADRWGVEGTCVWAEIDLAA